MSRAPQAQVSCKTFFVSLLLHLVHCAQWEIVMHCATFARWMKNGNICFNRKFFPKTARDEK
jgi:hypothetical protein